MASNIQELHTKRAVIWTSLCNEPLQTLYFTFLSIILYKQLHATPFQVAVLCAMRPLASLLSLYWSSIMRLHPERLVRNIIITGILTRLPFFFTPILENPWIMIAASSAYMMLTRGGIPSWMELLKQNLPEKKRTSVFSFGSALSYAEGIVISLGTAYLLDRDPANWKWLFPIGAGVGMLSIFFQMKMQQKVPVVSVVPTSFKHALQQPWKESLDILKSDKTFAFFQMCFMLAGCGIMMIAPAMPLFFVECLHLSYTEIAVAISIYKGLGFTLSSPLWSNFLNTRGLQHASTLLFFLFALYPLLLLGAIFESPLVYAACFLYGVAQGGSHLIWHISGTLFARNGRTMPYSNVGILLVGVRGAIMPALGSIIVISLGLIPTFVTSMLFCVGATFYSARKKIPLIAK